jgi:hypothetical protein
MTPELPKFIVEALEITQDAVIVSCTENVLVVVAANPLPAEKASKVDANKALDLISSAYVIIVNGGSTWLTSER